MNLSLIEYQSMYSGRDLAQPASPSLSEQMAAQFKLENLVGSTYTTYKDRPFAGFEEDPEWNPAVYMDENFGDLDEDEYIRKWSLIHDTNSEADANSRLRIDEEYKEARRVRDTMGTWTSLWTGAFAGITDPITLATLAVPVGSVVGAARGAAKIGGLVTAESAVVEGILHSQQDDRTLKESALNITANAILGGVVGGIGGSLKRSQFDREEASAAIRKTLDNEAMEIDDINTELGVDYKTIEELDAALARSELSGAAAIRNTTTAKWNPTLRGATNEFSMTVRGVWQQIASNSFLTRQAKDGEVGTASMSSATTAIETATGRFSGRQHNILLEGLKEWNRGKSIGTRAKEKIQGWDTFLEEVGVGFRKYDSETGTIDGVDVPKWQKDMYDNLIGIQKEYESLLSRKGMIDELHYVHTKKNGDQIERKVIDEERTAKKLAEYEEKLAKAKTDKTRQRYADEVEMHKDWLNLIKRYKNGDQTAASKILERIHGERRYSTQSWNKTQIELNKRGWFKMVTQAEKSWYLNQVSKYGKDTAMGRKFARDLARLRIGSKEYNERLEGIYHEITTDNTPISLGSFDNKIGSNPSQFKSRKLKIDQTRMTDFLKNNFMDLQNAHYSSVLPNLELKSRGLDNEGLKKIKELIVKEYEMHKNRARAEGDIEKVNKINLSQTQALKDIDHGIDLIKHEQYENVTQFKRDITFVISQFNATTKLGTMLIASLGDIAGVVAKTGIKQIAKAIIPTLRGFNKIIKDSTRSEIREMVGIMEMVSASRVHAINSSAELGVNQTAWARVAGRVSKTFYKATGILWWNQAIKEMAILGFSNRILGVNPKSLSKKDLAWFARDGMDVKKLQQVHDLYRRYPVPSEYDTKVINTGKIYEEFAESTGNNPQIIADAKLADEWNALLTKHANRTVVTPESGDLPMWMAKDPAMKLVGQFKGFGSASMNKTTIPMIQGIAMGDAHMAFGFLGLTAMGTGTYMLRQQIYNRPISDSWETLVYEGLLRGGGLGLYSDALSISQKLTNNWFTLGDKIGIEMASKYYSRSIVGDIAGPTIGLIGDVGQNINTASRLLSGEEVSDSDRARGVRMLPYNSLFYLRAVTENWDKFQ